MKTNERILRINSVLQNHFIKHPQSGMVLAKEFMPLFIENGIFNKDYREGLPIRKVLRALDTENSLDKMGNGAWLELMETSCLKTNLIKDRLMQ